MKAEKILSILAIIDSGKDVGLGHFKRVTNMLTQIKLPGWNTQTDYLLEKNFDRRIFPSQGKTYIADFSKTEDVLHTALSVDRSQPIHLFIIDSYKISEKTIKALMARHPDAATLMIDDFNRLKSYSCDFILNYNPTAFDLAYKTAFHTKRLFGLEYFPFSPKIKDSTRGKHSGAEMTNVLITMGGVDPDNFTQTICDAFVQGFDDRTFHIVIGPQFKQGKSLIQRYQDQKNFKLYRNLSDLTPLISKAGIAISSAGMTSYELAYLGKPTILIPISKDQLCNADFFRKKVNFLCVDFSLTRNRQKLSKSVLRNFEYLSSHPELQKKITAQTKRIFHVKSGVLVQKLQQRLKQKSLTREVYVH